MALRTVIRETPSIFGEIAFRRQRVVRRDRTVFDGFAQRALQLLIKR